MIKKTFVLLIALACCTFSSGQDSLKLESALSIEINGQHNLAAFVNNFDCINCAFNRVLDNPMHHLAIYLDVTHNLVINDNYEFETSIFAEERSYSGGNNTLSNLVFFPKILMEANDTINFFGKSIGTKIKGGDFWDEDMNDILRLYNIDYHGLDIVFYYDQWSLSFFTIGDLASNIGLDLHQLYRTSLGYQKV